MRTALCIALILLAPMTALGQSWVQVPPTTTWNFYSCWFDPSNPDRGAITGWRMVAWDQVSFLFTTGDGGRSLAQRDVYQGGFFLASQSVTFSSSNVGYLAGSGVLKTYDGGQNWIVSMDFGQANGKLTDIYFASSDSGYTVGEGWYGPTAMFFKTTNAGSTWTQHDPPVGSSTQLTCLARPSPHALYTGAGSAPGLRTLYKSTDDGNTWSTLSFYSSVYALCFTSNTVGCAGASGGIYRTVNGGASWSQVLTTPGNVNSVRIESGSGFAVTSTGSIYRTFDDGMTWTPMVSPVEGTAILYNLCLLSPQVAVAVGSGGTILRYGNVTGVESDEAEVAKGLWMESAPNPFQGTTTISYRVPAGGPVSLRLYDTLGREVRTMVDGDRPAGLHRVGLRSDHLPSGVYYCRLISEGVTETTKLLIER